MSTSALALAILLVACASPEPGPGGTGGGGTVGDGGSSEDGGGGGDGGTPSDGGDSGGDGGGDDTGGAVVAWVGSPWRRDEVATPGSLAFNELQYHPRGDDETEWVELYNPMALDMALSGWSLTGAVSYDFPEGTVLAAGGYLVVAADPDRLSAGAGVEGALGPWDGALSNGGERLSLSSNGGRTIDTIAYGDDDPWPVQADGSGHSLAKIRPDTASDRAEHWAVSAVPGGTPGASNQLDPLLPPTTLDLVAADATWAYDLSGVEPAADWTLASFDDRAWPAAPALFYAGASDASVSATAWATADNYFALYLGQADGTDLRWVGQDSDGEWWTVEEIALEATPWDHLYLAAWELSGDSGSTQMAIAEVELPDAVVGTTAEGLEWVLGPVGSNPGGLPGGTAPDEDELAVLVEEADALAGWAVPAVDAARTSSPWGGSIGALFSDAARYVWGDSFDAASLTNDEDTYALFRTVDPLVGPRGTTELASVPTTAWFRTTFSFEGDPAAAELHLECRIDDGAVVYLNGVELLRENLPAGTLDATTLASAPVAAARELYADVSSDALVRGENVLAVALHQAAPDDADLTFGCALVAEVWTVAGQPTLVLNELPPAGTTPAWVELRNASVGAMDTDGMVLSTSAGSEVALAAGEIAPGAVVAIEASALDLTADEVLFLYAADGVTLLDAVRIRAGHRARDPQGGGWRTPSAATPGAENQVAPPADVVIHEIQVHAAPWSVEGEPFSARDEEWIELYNRGEEAVDLGGWQLVDAVSWQFPEGTVLAPGGFLVVARDADALRALWPEVTIVGDFDGKLANDGERILLRDAVGNPVDGVRYGSGGRWPEAADGGGSTLELRDPWADNAAPEAWAASDEAARAGWVAVSYRGLATSSAVGPDGVWQELVLGLLDAGEVLIDDLSVVQDPDTAPLELVQNGGFDDGEAHWRLLGTHRHGEVVPDPDDPGNPVLRLVATGATGHMHNHVETTLLRDIGRRTYDISFRARWVSGSNQLHTRLYFQRLPRTTLLPQPEPSGTPGAPNSAAVDNLGPTFLDPAQDVVVPAPGQPVAFSIRVDDPDGLAEVTLWSSVDGGAWQDTAMGEGEPGRFSATLEGQDAGARVQLYVEAVDGRGAASTWPAGGPDGRALYAVDDGQAATHGLHNLRILMTEEDADWLHEDVNLMSDDLLGATVVYDEVEVYYDVGVRLKGSERGRPTTARLGYGLRFSPDQPFRGRHATVLVDRSEGVGFGQREVLQNLVMTHAGSVSGEHNDLVQLIAPRDSYTGTAELQLDRFSDLVLAAQFQDGDDGTRFEYELVYYPTTTDDGTAEGLKLPQPDDVIGTSLTDLGEDEEAYRWTFLIGNNLRQDDYAPLIGLCQAMGLSTPELLEVADEVIDVDQWLRAFALATLSGATDQYAAGSQHNAVFYQRPSDGRFLYFPHDLDYIGSATMAVVGSADLARLLRDPVWNRTFYGHLYDIVSRTYNREHLQPWCDQLGALLPGQDFDAHCAFVDQRADWVLNGASDGVLARYPEIGFEITTGGGEDFALSAAEVTLEGEGWVDVREVWQEGAAAPLALTWVDSTTWEVTVPLAKGANELVLVATDLDGQEVGRDTIVVTRE